MTPIEKRFHADRCRTLEANYQRDGRIWSGIKPYYPTLGEQVRRLSVRDPEDDPIDCDDDDDDL